MQEPKIRVGIVVPVREDFKFTGVSALRNAEGVGELLTPGTYYREVTPAVLKELKSDPGITVIEPGTKLKDGEATILTADEAEFVNSFRGMNDALTASGGEALTLKEFFQKCVDEAVAEKTNPLADLLNQPPTRPEEKAPIPPRLVPVTTFPAPASTPTPAKETAELEEDLPPPSEGELPYEDEATAPVNFAMGTPPAPAATPAPVPAPVSEAATEKKDKPAEPKQGKKK